MRARLYDWECRQVLGRTDQDLPWLIESVGGRSPVLELACGTGRITLPLAGAGLDVVGLDIDPEMLAGLRSAGSKLAVAPRVLAGDMRAFSLSCSFGAVIIPYNSIQLLTEPGEAEACLRGAAAHLRDGGVVAIEVCDFQAGARSARVDVELVHRGTFDGATAWVWGGLEHDFGARLSTYHHRVDLTPGATVLAEQIVLRCYDPAELADTLDRAGLAPLSWWHEGATTRVVAAAAQATSQVLPDSSSACRSPGPRLADASTSWDWTRAP